MSDHEYRAGGVSRVNYIYMCRAIQLLYNYAIGVIQGIHCMQYGAGCVCLPWELVRHIVGKSIIFHN